MAPGKSTHSLGKGSLFSPHPWVRQGPPHFCRQSLEGKSSHEGIWASRTHLPTLTLSCRTSPGQAERTHLGLPLNGTKAPLSQLTAPPFPRAALLASPQLSLVPGADSKHSDFCSGDPQCHLLPAEATFSFPFEWPQRVLGGFTTAQVHGRCSIHSSCCQDHFLRSGVAPVSQRKQRTERPERD